MVTGGDASAQCCFREQVGYALYARFREPKLFRYVELGDWDLIPARCRTHPAEARFVHKYAPHDTVLHWLLRHSTTQSTGSSSTCLDHHSNHHDTTDDTTTTTDDTQVLQCIEEWKMAAVEALLAANRQAASHRDALGKTALHLACMDVSPPRDCSSSWSTSSFHSSHVAPAEPSTDPVTSSSSSSTAAVRIALQIAHANPGAALVQDSIDQRTPLHYLVARNAVIPIQLLQQLLVYAPSAVLWPDATGDTPAAIVRQRHDEIVHAPVVLQILEQAASAVATLLPSPVIAAAQEKRTRGQSTSRAGSTGSSMPSAASSSMSSSRSFTTGAA